MKTIQLDYKHKLACRLKLYIIACDFIHNFSRDKLDTNIKLKVSSVSYAQIQKLVWVSYRDR